MNLAERPNEYQEGGKLIPIKQESRFVIQRTPEKLILPVSDGFEFVNVKDIIYLKAEGSYTKLSLQQNKNLLICKSLKEMEKKINNPAFLRVHQTFLVNMEFVQRYNQREQRIELCGEQQIRVSRSGNQRVKKFIQQFI